MHRRAVCGASLSAGCIPGQHVRIHHEVPHVVERAPARQCHRQGPQLCRVGGCAQRAARGKDHGLGALPTVQRSPCVLACTYFCTGVEYLLPLAEGACVYCMMWLDGCAVAGKQERRNLVHRPLLKEMCSRLTHYQREMLIAAIPVTPSPTNQPCSPPLTRRSSMRSASLRCLSCTVALLLLLLQALHSEAVPDLLPVRRIPPGPLPQLRPPIAPHRQHRLAARAIGRALQQGQAHWGLSAPGSALNQQPCLDMNLSL